MEGQTGHKRRLRELARREKREEKRRRLADRRKLKAANRAGESGAK
jgi:hypothetical protein